jgi:hypothetical protein
MLGNPGSHCEKIEGKEGAETEASLENDTTCWTLISGIAVFSRALVFA